MYFSGELKAIYTSLQEYIRHRHLLIQKKALAIICLAPSIPNARLHSETVVCNITNYPPISITYIYKCPLMALKFFPTSNLSFNAKLIISSTAIASMILPGISFPISAHSPKTSKWFSHFIDIPNLTS